MQFLGQVSTARAVGLLALKELVERALPGADEFQQLLGLHLLATDGRVALPALCA